MNDILKCIIIGSGPAGYTAAVYAARANLQPVLIEGMLPGGQLTQTSIIENYPGFPEGISGLDLMDNMQKQAVKFGTVIKHGRVTSVDFSQSPKKIVLDNSTELFAESVIISTGASAKHLGIADEIKYSGKGVSACATCDGFFYRKKIVAIVGGGDTACSDALYLSGLCKMVYLIVRKPYLRATKILQDRLSALENVKILYNSKVSGLFGTNEVEGANLLVNDGTLNVSESKLSINGLFLAIGHHPNSDLFQNILDIDENGYLLTMPNSQSTKIKGIYVAGDVCDSHYQQAITAAASGCRAAIEATSFLSSK